MAVQNPYLTTDGDINQAKRKRAGESMAIDAVPNQTSFDMTNTPATRVQPGVVPGNPARAAQMQAQFNQPVSKGSSPLLAVQPAVGGGGGDQRPAIAGDSAGLQRMIGGSLSIAPAAIWEGAKNLGTDLQNTAYSLIDAEPVPRPGYPRTTQLAQEIAGGASAFSDANSNLLSSAKGGARDLVGAKQAPQPATPQQPASPTAATASSGPAAAAPKPEAAAPIKTTANPASPANPTVEPVPESPYFATGTDQIAVRMNGSTPEFTNDKSAVAGARAMPTGGRGSPLLAPGFSNMADDVPLEQRGSINNVGNGIGGGISYGEAGDAKLAIERFGRANDIRAQTIAERPREIGDTGKITGIMDNSRAPTLAERQRAVVDQQQAQTEAARAQTQQSAAEINQGIAADTQRMQTEQLNQQRLQQELAAGQYGVQDRERIATLQARMVDPSLSEEERAVAREAYTALSTQAKDRYQSQDVILGRDLEGRDIRGTQLIDVTTGKPLVGIGGNPQNAQLNSDLEQARRIIASDPAKRAEIEKRLQQAYGRGLDG
ncbi:MAG: hypothetical protein ACKVIS_16730 [Pseudomonadales bacterium]